MDLCPYDETPLDRIGKKFYVGLDRHMDAGLASLTSRDSTIVYVRVFHLCPTCGRHFHSWLDSFKSEAMPKN